MKGAHFFGYELVETWAGVIDPAHPVYALLHRQDAPGDLGSTIERHLITVSQPDDAGHLHYCRIVVGRLTRCGGQPWEEDAAKRLAQSQAAWGIVRAWLGEQGFTVREALAAFPRDVVLMEGGTRFLVWDGEKGEFRRRSG